MKRPIYRNALRPRQLTIAERLHRSQMPEGIGLMPVRFTQVCFCTTEALKYLLLPVLNCICHTSDVFGWQVSNGVLNPAFSQVPSSNHRNRIPKIEAPVPYLETYGF